MRENGAGFLPHAPSGDRVHTPACALTGRRILTSWVIGRRSAWLSVACFRFPSWLFGRFLPAPCGSVVSTPPALSPALLGRLAVKVTPEGASRPRAPRNTLPPSPTSQGPPLRESEALAHDGTPRPTGAAGAQAETRGA